MTLRLEYSPEGNVPYWNGEPLEDPRAPVTAAGIYAEKYAPKKNKLYVIFGSGGDYRVRALVEAGAVQPCVYEPGGPEVVDAFERTDKAKYFTSISDVIGYASSYPGEDIVVTAPEAYMKAFPKEWDGFVKTLYAAEASRRVRKNTMKFRGGAMIENVLRNAHWMAELKPAPSLNKMGAPVLEGQTVFCVAAGPSLDVNGHLLTAAREKGYVFTASTAGKAVMLHHGCRSDIHMSIESVRQDGPLNECREHADIYAMDLTCHPKNLEAAMKGPAIYFMPSAGGIQELYQIQKAPPLPYGSSVATAAVALAHAYGAKRIVLLGQDLSYHSGKAYATGTGREHYWVEDRGQSVYLHRDDEFYSHFTEAQVPAPTPDLAVERWPGWGGGEDVGVTPDMMLFMDWFRMFADGVDGVELINATEGGAEIPGWKSETLESVLSRCEPVERGPLMAAYEAAKPVKAGPIREYKAKVKKGLAKVRRMAETVANNRDYRTRAAGVERLGQLISAIPALDSHCSPQFLRLHENEQVPPEDRSYWICRLTVESCDKLADACA